VSVTGSGRSVTIGEECLEVALPATVIDTDRSVRSTGPYGKLEAVIAHSKRDEQCHVQVRVSYVDQEYTAAPTVTFRIREVGNHNVPFARDVTLELGTTVLLDLGDEDTFNNARNLRF